MLEGGLYYIPRLAEHFPFQCFLDGERDCFSLLMYSKNKPRKCVEGAQTLRWTHILTQIDTSQPGSQGD